MTENSFFSPQLILQFYRGALMIYFKENLCFSKVPGVQLVKKQSLDHSGLIYNKSTDCNVHDPW